MIFSRFPKLKKYSLESDTTKERKKEKNNRVKGRGGRSWWQPENHLFITLLVHTHTHI